MRSLVKAGFSGDSILSDMRALVRQAIEDGYVNGLVQGGIPADEVSDDDALMIIELDTQQQDFIPDFVKAVRDAKKDRELQQSILDTRIPLWVASIEAAGMAGLNSAKANEMVEFTGDDGAESCPTCQRLKGQRHRRKWFVGKGLVPGEPGNSNFECNGFNCAHRLTPIK